MVQLPEKHVLVQSGRQLEWMTGGYLKAGFHEVIHTQQVEQKKQERLKEGKSSWRVASTLFCHVEGDLSIQPLEKFRSAEVDKLYPNVTSSEYLSLEFKDAYPDSASSS